MDAPIDNAAEPTTSCPCADAPLIIYSLYTSFLKSSRRCFPESAPRMEHTELPWKTSGHMALRKFWSMAVTGRLRVMAAE